MVLLGNVLVAALALLMVALGRLHWAGMPGGDRGVGHAWMLLLGHGALLLLLLALTALVAAAGRLTTWPQANDWPLATAFGFVLLCGGLAAAAAVAAPGGGPLPLRLLPLVVPLLLAVVAVRLLNGDPHPASADPFVGPALALVALLSIAAALVLLAPAALRQADTARAIASRSAGALDNFQQGLLQRIESLDPAQHFVELLGHTRAGNHARLRNAALARLQSVDDWPQRVRDALDGPGAGEAFEFLAAHEVPDPASFAVPVVQGIHRQAQRVRERIRAASHPSHLYEGLMIFEVQALLRTLQRHATTGVDHRPALQGLRDAFAEPSDYPHPRYRAVQAVDDWLGRRR